MKKIITIVKDLFRYFQIPQKEKNLTLFIEKISDINYFNRFLIDLYKSLDLKVVILTSQIIEDKKKFNSNFEKEFIYIGSGLVRYLYFRFVNTKVFLMTTPDLENSELKKSINQVKYFYIFHSLASSHSIYNHNAFKHYDYILSASPQHCREIRYLEKLYKDKSKIVLPFGYPRILDLKKEYLDNSVNVKNKRTQKTILIAPTWGSSSITETCLENLFQQLVLMNHKIIYRPHPISLSENKNYILKMKNKFRDKIIFENDISKTNYLNYVDTLITDWSGFSLEFFFTTLKPTIFIDTPPKIKNKNFNDVKIEPIESVIRKKIGTIITIKDIQKINQKIELVSKRTYKLDSSEYIYDYSKNYKNIINEIKLILNETVNDNLQK